MVNACGEASTGINKIMSRGVRGHGRHGGRGYRGGRGGRNEQEEPKVAAPHYTVQKQVFIARNGQRLEDFLQPTLANGEQSAHGSSRGLGAGRGGGRIGGRPRREVHSSGHSGALRECDHGGDRGKGNEKEVAHDSDKHEEGRHTQTTRGRGGHRGVQETWKRKPSLKPQKETRLSPITQHAQASSLSHEDPQASPLVLQGAEGDQRRPNMVNVNEDSSEGVDKITGVSSGECGRGPTWVGFLSLGWKCRSRPLFPLFFHTKQDEIPGKANGDEESEHVIDILKDDPEKGQLRITGEQKPDDHIHHPPEQQGEGETSCASRAVNTNFVGTMIRAIKTSFPLPQGEDLTYEVDMWNKLALAFIGIAFGMLFAVMGIFATIETHGMLDMHENAPKSMRLSKGLLSMAGVYLLYGFLVLCCTLKKTVIYPRIFTNVIIIITVAFYLDIFSVIWSIDKNGFQ